MTVEVTVYSKADCIQCKMTKTWLETAEVQFTEINVEEKPESIEQLKLHGFSSLPVVAINSLDNAWAGFRPERLKDLIS